MRELLDVRDPARNKVNRPEAQALVQELERRLEDPRYVGMSFGVLSLFREQIEYIQVLVVATIPRQRREMHRLICSTVDGFQGDERDVILYSWRYAHGTSPAVFAFTGGEGGQQRVNVALSRARHQGIHFISAPIDRFPLGATNVTPFLRHAVGLERLLALVESRAHQEPSGRARREIDKAVSELGLNVEENFVAAGTSIDLLVRDGSSGKRVGVFVDAEVDQFRRSTRRIALTLMPCSSARDGVSYVFQPQWLSYRRTPRLRGCARPSTWWNRRRAQAQELSRVSTYRFQHPTPLASMASTESQASRSHRKTAQTTAGRFPPWRRD